MVEGAEVLTLRASIGIVASVLLAPLAGAVVDPCAVLAPVPCVPTPNRWLNNTCGDASFLQGYAFTTLEILLIATGIGCGGPDIALP